MEEIIQNRKCTKCLIEKPLTTEFWYHQFKGRSQFQYTCKSCYKKIDKERYQKNKQYIKLRNKNNKEKNSMDAPLVKIEKIEN